MNAGDGYTFLRAVTSKTVGFTLLQLVAPYYDQGCQKIYLICNNLTKFIADYLLHDTMK